MAERPEAKIRTRDVSSGRLLQPYAALTVFVEVLAQMVLNRDAKLRLRHVAIDADERVAWFYRAAAQRQDQLSVCRFSLRTGHGDLEIRVFFSRDLSGDSLYLR